MTSLEKGNIGESLIFTLLKDHSIETEWLPVGENADFKLSDGRLIDVKFSKQSSTKNSGWRFNLHHHGEKQPDIAFFICIARKENGSDMIFVMPGHLLGGKTWTISERQIDRGTYDYFQDNFDIIKNKA